MYSGRRIFTALCAGALTALFVCACATRGIPGADEVFLEFEPLVQDEYEAEIPLREKIAQMIITGFRGTELTGGNHIYEDVAGRGIGGVILFDYDFPSASRIRNIVSREQLTALCAGLQEAARQSRLGHRLFIAVDQEGGAVNRLKTRNGFPETKSAADLAKGGEGLTARQAEETAKLLAGMGINLNFAPCVDLNLNPKNPIIGSIGRSFSADPHIVTSHASTWISAHSREGILSCIKHFPGHGSSRGDTHRGTVDVSSVWREEELVPYRELIRRSSAFPGLMVMTSHVFNENLDPLHPATLSEPILTRILRDALGFQGIIVSDDLNMSAIAAEYPLDISLEKAINAGVNLLCFSNNGNEYDPYLAERVISAVENLVADGNIKKETIDESYRRITKTKEQLKF